MMNNLAARYSGGPGMMGSWGGDGWQALANPYVSSLYLALHIITWILVIAILVAVLRWLWRKGGK